MAEKANDYSPIVSKAGSDMVDLFMATEYRRISDSRLRAYMEGKGLGIYYEDLLDYLSEHIPYLSYQPKTRTWKVSPMLEEEMDDCEKIMLSYAELNRTKAIKVPTKELEKRMKKLQLPTSHYIRYKILLVMWYGVRCNRKEQEEWVFQRVYGAYGGLQRYVGQVREIITHLQHATFKAEGEEVSEVQIIRYLMSRGYEVDNRTYKDIREAIYTLVEREEAEYLEDNMKIYYKQITEEKKKK